MSRIHIVREHPFSIEEAKQRLEVLRDRLREKAGIETEWSGNDLNVKGRGASGTIVLSKETIEVQLKLSMMLSPLKSTIEQKIDEGLDKAINGAAT